MVDEDIEVSHVVVLDVEDLTEVTQNVVEEVDEYVLLSQVVVLDVDDLIVVSQNVVLEVEL